MRDPLGSFVASGRVPSRPSEDLATLGAPKHFGHPFTFDPRSSAPMKRTAAVLVAATMAFPISLASSPRFLAVPRHSTPLGSCIEGSWKEVGETDVVGIAGGLMTLRGDSGRLLTFDKGGTEILEYSHATPLVGSYRGTEYKIVLRGTISLAFTVKGDRVKFVKSDYSHFEETFIAEGRSERVPMSGLPRAVTVSCGVRTLSQTSTGYQGTFTRIAH